MTIKKLVVNPLQENCYILHEGDDAPCVIVDCGAMWPDEDEAIATYIRQHGLRPEAHLLTHAHFDHCWGAGFLFEEYGIGPRMHPADADIYTHLDQQTRMLIGTPYTGTIAPLAEPILAETVITLARHDITVIPTPGHTRGGVCYLLADEGVLFSGDTLFCGSVGRTDFPGGSTDELLCSLQTLCQRLVPEGGPVPAVTIYPGHGPATTIEAEMRTNPYLRG